MKIFFKKSFNFLIFSIFLTIALLLASTIMTNYSKATEILNFVTISPVGVKMPLNQFLIIRHETAYGALKFVKFWTGKTEQDFFARYRLYYQENTTGNFLNQNVKFTEEELSFPKPRGVGRFSFSFGKKDIRFGSFNLFWFGEGSVYFFGSHQPEGDYGIEFAPTKWTDISEVNVFDSRLKWYRYDSKRQTIKLNIDDIWSDDAK